MLARMKLMCRFGTWSLFLWLASTPPAQAGRQTGPWDLAALARPPAVTWGDTTGAVRSLYYAGEPFEGRPTRVFAYYAVPAKVTGKLPAMVLVHGGGGKAFREWAELWAKRGYAALAMDLAGHGPDGQRLPDGGPDQGSPEKFDRIARGVKEAWPYHAVANVLRAVSLLGSFQEVDPERLGITGISWGGYLTCIVAGLDERLKVAIPVYGCGFLHENSAWLATFAKLPAADRDLWIKTFDPSHYLPGCAMPILFVNGTNDTAYPLDSHQKSYRLVRGPRTLCVTVRMPHGHQAGWKPVEIGLFADAVLRGGQPLPEFTAVSRDGGQVTAAFKSAVPVEKAALHYTTDRGEWKDRSWQTVPAELRDGTARAALPADKGIVYFLTLTDRRGAVVSTEHVVLAP
jgi:dienelactone hydrolase